VAVNIDFSKDMSSRDVTPLDLNVTLTELECRSDPTASTGEVPRKSGQLTFPQIVESTVDQSIKRIA
jgi:hypothetical protein